MSGACAACGSDQPKELGFCVCDEPCCTECAMRLPDGSLECFVCECKARLAECDAPCECIQTDVDVFDASGCPAHGAPVQRGGWL